MQNLSFFFSANLPGKSGFFYCKDEIANRQTQQACTRISSHVFKLAIILFVFILAQKGAHAQCNTFHNADSANPILNASPAPQNINGLQFVDIDGDGDFDCYLLSGSSLLLYRNDGTKKSPRYVLCPNTGFENSGITYFYKAFSFADMDGDGDIDFVTEESNHASDPRGISYRFTYYENTGTTHTPAFVQSGNNPIAAAEYYPHNGYDYINLQDIDGDGDVDLFYTALGQLYYQYQYIYLNTGSAAAPAFSLYSQVGSPFQYEYWSFYDFTGDGLPDAFTNNGTNSDLFLSNDGTPSAPSFPFDYDEGPNIAGIAPYVITDLNGDGEPEEFNINGHYATFAPVAVINKSESKVGNYSVTKLSASAPLDGYTYNWEYNGKMVPGYHKPFIYALKKGEYILYINDTCGTGVSLPYHTTDNNLIAANATLSADDFTVADNMISPPISAKAYPNPFTSQFVIQIPMAGKAIQSTIKITDLAGRKILSQTISATSVTTGKTLPRGTYLVQVWQENKLVFHTMMIKQ